MHTAIAELEQAQIRSDIPDFRPGDTLKVHVRVTEGTRSRIQVFQGIVIRRQGGSSRKPPARCGKSTTCLRRPELGLWLYCALSPRRRCGARVQQHP